MGNSPSIMPLAGGHSEQMLLDSLDISHMETSITSAVRSSSLVPLAEQSQLTAVTLTRIDSLMPVRYSSRGRSIMILTQTMTIFLMVQKS